MRWAMGILAAAVMAGSAAAVLGEGAAATQPVAMTAPDVAAQVAKAVRELGDRDMAVREAASARLLSFGKAALPAITAALKSPDLEVAIRARRLIRDLKAGITPEMAPEVADVLRDYVDADPAQRGQMISQLGGMGASAAEPLLLLSQRETDPQLSQAIRTQLLTHTHAVVRLMLQEGKTAQAERYLELGRQSGNSALVRDWAAYSVVTGHYAAERKRLEPQAGSAAEARTQEQRDIARDLAYLHRAQGEAALAMEAARASGDETLIYDLLVEQGDWRGLLSWDGRPALDVLPYRATAARALAAYYAGDTAKYQAGLEEVRKEAAGPAPNGGGKPAPVDGRYPATLDYLNRPDEAAAALVQQEDTAGAVELLASRGLYDEALEKAEAAKRDGVKDLPQVLVREAVMLKGLGEVERGDAILKEIGAKQVPKQSAPAAAGSPQEELQRSGRAAAREKDWERMAASYEELAKIEKTDWPRYLQGYALVQAGKKQEGEALEKRADLLMLADSEERYALAEEAQAAALGDVALQVYARLMSFSKPLDVNWINGAGQLAMSGKLEAGRAARLQESFIVAEAGSSGFLEGNRPDLELYVARKQHELAARAAAARQDWPAATEEMKAGLALYPGDGEGLFELAAMLDAAGRKDDADALVALQVKYFTHMLAKYPRAAELHNNLAWLYAKTGRNLDEALKQAEAAVKLFPKSAGYIDTLAEVHFARGEFAAAVELEKQAVNLEPDAAALHQSLARFEAAAAKKGP